MPQVKLVFFKDQKGKAPALEFLESIPERAQAKAEKRLEHLHIKKAVVLSHGLIKKKSAVPSKEIDLAVQRKFLFRGNPEKYSYEEE